MTNNDKPMADTIDKETKHDAEERYLVKNTWVKFLARS